MNPTIRDTLVPVALSCILTASAQANTIRIDFSGTISGTADTGATQAFAGGISVGDTFTGMLTFDDAVVNGFARPDGNYSDPALHNWLSSSVTVNGTTYSVSPLSGYAHTDSIDRGFVLGDVVTQAGLVDAEYGYVYDGDGNVVTKGSNYLTLSTANSSFFNGDSSLSHLESLLTAGPTSFYFQTWVYSNTDSSYLTYGTFSATAGTVTVTDLGVPLPGALILFTSGLAGLGLRRLSSK
jgi:hypothetical protein